MNTKRIICMNAYLAIPSMVNSISGDTITYISGYSPVKIDVKTGTLTENSSNLPAGKFVYQKVDIKGTIVSGNIGQFNKTAIVVVNIENVGQKILGSIEIPSQINQIDSSGDGIQIIADRKTTAFEFM